eukprot:3098649-Pyramimonas_sp.AAC.1
MTSARRDMPRVADEAFALLAQLRPARPPHAGNNPSFSPTSDPVIRSGGGSASKCIPGDEPTASGTGPPGLGIAQPRDYHAGVIPPGVSSLHVHRLLHLLQQFRLQAKELLDIGPRRRAAQAPVIAARAQTISTSQ